MYPIALQFGNFAIRWYGVMAAVGFLLGSWVIYSNRKRLDISEDRCSGVLLTAMISGIVGARIFYVVQFFEHYRGNLFNIIRIDQGGLVFYGGFILAIFSILVYCRIYKIDFVRLLDFFAPAIAIAHACGRIGCFLNGCCFGRPANGFFSVTYPANSAPQLKYPGCSLAPVQLYEAAENIVLFFIFFHLCRKTKRGVAMSSYLIAYGVLRFINECWRGDNPKIWGLLTPAQLIGTILIPAGTIMLIYFIRHERKNS
ncbi:MAG: prolipoprotein diacylglyceryl transferase [Lentisphaeria bacterium]|nr:prolipoprotein diacylglyceryl transferase [Lentisphaeria bacterium]MBO5900672.1 prolipoprotein diacylglyceryl transferase [Lentisphaeria bacterium]